MALKFVNNYSVGGKLVDVAYDRDGEFRQDVMKNGDTAEKIHNFRVDGKDGVQRIVPVSERNVDKFKADAEANGDNFVRVFNVSDGNGGFFTISEPRAQEMVKLRAGGQTISRRRWAEAGLPEEFGRDRHDRANFVSQLAYRLMDDANGREQGVVDPSKMFTPYADGTSPDEIHNANVDAQKKLNLSQWEREKLATEMATGEKNPGFLKTLASAVVPGVRTAMSVDAKKDENDVAAVATGRYVDKDSLANAAHNFLTEEEWNQVPWMSPTLLQTHGQFLQNKASEWLKGRYDVRSIGQDRRSRDTQSTAGEIIEKGRGALDSIVTYSNPAFLPLIFGNKYENNGRDVAKASAGTAAEYAIWNLVPGAGHASTAFVGKFGKEALNVWGNVLKSKTTDLVDNVAGMAVEDKDRKSFAKWLDEFTDPIENSKTMLEFALIHGGSKAIGALAQRASKEGRDAIEARNEIRRVMAETLGEERVKHLTDTDVMNLSKIVGSDGLTQQKVAAIIRSVEKDLGAVSKEAIPALDQARQNLAMKEREARGDVGMTKEQSAEIDKVAAEWGVLPEQVAEAKRKIIESSRGDSTVPEDSEGVKRTVIETADNGLNADGKHRHGARNKAESDADRADRERKIAERIQGNRDAAEIEREMAAEDERKKAESKANELAAEEAQKKSDDERASLRKKDVNAAFINADTKSKKEAKRREDAEWDAKEEERKAREAAEEAEVPEIGHEQSAKDAEQEASRKENSPDLSEKTRTEEYPEYDDWLKKSGRSDSDKNWNRFVAENDLDPNLKVMRGRDGKGVSVKPVADKNIETPAAEEQVSKTDTDTSKHRKPANASVEPRRETKPIARTESSEDPTKATEASPANADEKDSIPLPKKPLAKPVDKSAEKTDATASQSSDMTPKEAYKVLGGISYSRSTAELQKELKNTPESAAKKRAALQVAIKEAQKRAAADLKAKDSDAQAAKKAVDEFRKTGDVEKLRESVGNMKNGQMWLKWYDSHTSGADVDVIAEAKKKLADRIYNMEFMRAEDRVAILQKDKDVHEWARKNGFSVVDGNVAPTVVNKYQKARAMEAVKATKNLFKDAKVEYLDGEYDPEKDSGSVLKDSNGRVVGTFDTDTKAVKLFRGADEKTVYHELIGHGVEDWANRNRKNGLHGKLMELAKTAPKDLVDDIRRRYPEADESTFAKEIIAAFAERSGSKSIKLFKEAPKNWVAKAYVAVRNAIVGFFRNLGIGGKINLAKIEGMTPAEVMDYIMTEAGKGKTLGNIGETDGGKVGAFEKWANAIYDRHTSLSKLSQSAYEAKTLQPGREYEFQINKFDKKKEEYGRLLKDGDISHEEVADYMRAVAALERNKADRERAFAENKMPFDGNTSGMDDMRAKEIVSHYEKHPRFKAIKETADFLWKMQNEGIEERIRSGILSRDEYNEWAKREPHHVPFRSAVDETTGEHIAWNSKGVSGPEFQQHLGRYTESGDPIAWMFEEYADAHLRAIENETRKALAADVAANKHLGFVSTDPRYKEMRVKGDGGNANVVSFKDGGKVRTIFLNGERGSAAASSYTNRDLKKMWSPVKKFMRFWSATATEWSPTFAVRNFIKDNSDLAMMVITEKGAKEGAKWVGSYMKNLKQTRKEVKEFAKTGKVVDGSIIDRYIKAGGMIGGFEREGYSELTNKFSYENIKKDFSSGKDRGKTMAGAFKSWIKEVNTRAELQTRIAAFATNVNDAIRKDPHADMKKAEKDAAIWSRQATVDFNRKGNMTPIMNSLFMFSNSIIGSKARQAKAITKAWNSGSSGKLTVLVFAAAGAAEAWLEDKMNDDDVEGANGKTTTRDINEFSRKNNFYLRFGDRTVNLPVHDDLISQIKYYGNAMYRLSNGKLDAGKFAKEVAGDAVGNATSFAGMGAASIESWPSFLPTLTQPVFQDLGNTNFMGDPIRRQKFDETLPDSYNSRNSTNGAWKWISEHLNDATGGNEGRPGTIDITPETLKHYSDSIGKSVGKDVFNVGATLFRAMTLDFDAKDTNEIPFLRDVTRVNASNDNRYFDASEKFKTDRNEYNRMSSSWTYEERAKYRNDHPWVLKGGRADTLQSRINTLRNKEKGVIKVNGKNVHKEFSETDVRKFREERQRLQNEFDAIVNGRK